MTRGWARSWVGVAVLGLAVAAGCGKAAPSTTTTTTSSGGGQTTAAGGTSTAPSAGSGLVVTTPAPTGEVPKATWAVYRETNSLDPVFAFDYPENTVIFTMCEALMRQQPDGSVVPGLATAIDSTDPTSLVVTLRPNVKFWDGHPVTADDVVYSLKRNTDKNVGGFYGAVFSRVTSIAATGPLEVTIKLKQADYWLLGELSSLPGIVLEKQYVEAKGKKYGTPSGGAMCTGPYKLKQWKTGNVLAVERNDAYWDQSLRPKVAEIDFKGAPDEAGLTSALQTGEIDGYYSLQLATLDQLRSSPTVKVYLGPSYISDAFIISSFKGTLGDVRVRQALSMAIDRQGYIGATWKGASQIPHALGNPGTWGYSRDVFQKGYDALPPMNQDLTAAKALIQKAGAAGKSIVIGESSELASVQTSANALKSAAEAIGLKATLHSVSAANYINYFTDPKARAGIDGFFTQNYGDYADPVALYQTIAEPDGSQNYTGYSNPEVVKLFEAARGEADPAKRAQDVVDGQKLMTADMPWIPMSVPDTVLILNKRLTGAPASFLYMDGPWAAYLGAAG